MQQYELNPLINLWMRVAGIYGMAVLKFTVFNFILLYFWQLKAEEKIKTVSVGIIFAIYSFLAIWNGINYIHIYGVL